MFEMDQTDQSVAKGSAVGDRLRQAREAKGLTLDDVATETRIPIRHLRNIEDGNWEDLPAVTYTVGFARSYANSVGLDGAAVGQEVREQFGGVGRAPSVSPEVYAAPDPARVPSRGLAWGALLVLVALVAAWLLVIRPWLTRDDATATAPAATEEPVAAAEQPAQPAPQPQQAPIAAGQPVVLVATGEVWMSITDRASNRRLFYDTLQPGSRFDVPADAAQPVLNTTNPQNLRIMVGGQDRGPLAAERRRINNQSLKAEDLAGLFSQPPGGTPAPAPGPASTPQP